MVSITMTECWRATFAGGHVGVLLVLCVTMALSLSS
jgi:hypothetical protein